MTIRRCKHEISINLPFLKKLLNGTSKEYVYENAYTNIRFKVEMSLDEKKALASHLITITAKG